MLDQPPLLTINRRFTRLPEDVIAGFRGAMTGHVVDSQIGAMAGRGALDPSVKAINPAQQRFCGSAITVQAQPGDNLAIHAATEVAQPGDVILVATGGYRDSAILGDLLGGVLKNCGALGFVTDGFVRDYDGIAGLDWPVFAAGLNPNSPTCVGPGVIGCDIVMGRMTISSGDLVIADADGVVVVPHADASQVLEKLEETRRAEAAAEARVMAGHAVSSKYMSVKDRGDVLILE